MYQDFGYASSAISCGLHATGSSRDALCRTRVSCMNLSARACQVLPGHVDRRSSRLQLVQEAAEMARDGRLMSDDLMSDECLISRSLRLLQATSGLFRQLQADSGYSDMYERGWVMPLIVGPPG